MGPVAGPSRRQVFFSFTGAGVAAGSALFCANAGVAINGARDQRGELELEHDISPE
jgi:hypothetical protein